MPLSNLGRLCAGLCAALPLLISAAALAQDDRYNDSYQQNESPRDGGSAGRSDDYSRSAANHDDAYRPPADSYDRAPRDDYNRAPRDESYESRGRRDSFSNEGREGNAYSPPPPGRDYGNNSGYPDPQGPRDREPSHYDEGEIVAAGHSFFGSVTKGLASAVEYAFKSQGRPNGYILGEDASGAFIVGLRYGEGRLFTKDAGTHKVYWQGPSLGYDMGADGSKTMVLVYNLHDPSDIFQRFGGAEGTAYLVGGVSVQFQTYDQVTLAVIRSGLGLRLGANVGYSKYSRSPTWNPL